MSKISAYSYDTSPTTSDYLLGNSASGPTTQKFQIATLLALLGAGGTELSSQIQSQANSGTAGGTIYWINLGGLKILWGNTPTQVSYGAPAYTVAFPTFFTTIQAFGAWANTMGTDIAQTVLWAETPATTGGAMYFDTLSGSAGAHTAASYIVVGI